MTARSMRAVGISGMAEMPYFSSRHGIPSIDSAREMFRQRQFQPAFFQYLQALSDMPDENKKQYRKEFLETVEHYLKSDGSNGSRKLLWLASNLFSEDYELTKMHAEFLFELGYIMDSVDMFRKVIEYSSCENEWLTASVALENARSHLFDQWHWRMLNDETRNSAFAKGINKAVELVLNNTDQPVHVLDLGCGSGILSVLAERALETCGDKRSFVTAVDSSHVMSKIATCVFAQNQCRAKVECLHSGKFQTDSLVSLIVSETLDCAIFGERICSSLVDVYDRLASDDFFVTVPRKATMYICLCESTAIEHQNFYETNEFVMLSQDCYLNSCSDDLLPNAYDCAFLEELPGGYKLLSKPKELFTVDFEDVTLLKSILKGKLAKKVELQVEEPGRLSAVVGWFKLNVMDDINITTEPKSGSCWPQAVFPLFPNQLVNTGDNLQFHTFVRDERLYVRPLNLQRLSKQPLKASDELNFIAMNNMELKHFFRDSVSKMGANKAIDFTDLVLEESMNEGNDKQVELYCCSSRPIIRYVGKRPVKPTDAPDDISLILHWPFNNRGQIDQGRLLRVMDIALESESQTFLSPSHLSLYAMLIKSPSLLERAKLVTDDKRPATYCGVNVGAMERCNVRYYEEVDPTSAQFEQLSEPTKLYEMDIFSYLIDHCPPLIHRAAKIQPRGVGECHGLLFWLEVSTERNGPRFSFRNTTVSAFLFDEPHDIDGELGEEEPIELLISMLEGQFLFQLPKWNEPRSYRDNLLAGVPRIDY